MIHTRFADAAIPADAGPLGAACRPYPQTLPADPLPMRWDAKRGVFRQVRVLTPHGLTLLVADAVSLLILIALAHGLLAGAAHGWRP